MQGEAKGPAGAKCRHKLKEAERVSHSIGAAPVQKVSDGLMATVMLLLGDAIFPFASLGLKQVCDMCASGATSSPYHVQSKVSFGLFRFLLEAVSGKDIQITNENVLDVSQLCEEFGFWSLSAKVSAFCQSSEHRIWLLKARLSEQAQPITTLQTDIQKQRQVIPTLQADTQKQLAAEVEQLKASSQEVKAKQNGQKRVIAALKDWTKFSDSLVDSSFPQLFDHIRGKRFVLLWQGSRYGFGVRDFHGRCDGHANTLQLILDTGGNVFVEFTLIQWESENKFNWKCDDSLNHFLFAMKNPDNILGRNSH
jgi:uncharacterized coiled-coil protein SlyX